MALWGERERVSAMQCRTIICMHAHAVSRILMSPASAAGPIICMTEATEIIIAIRHTL